MHLRTMWTIGLIVVMASSVSVVLGGGTSKRFTIEQLLSTSFPYTDPRTDNQLDMDPCKSGKWFD